MYNLLTEEKFKLAGDACNKPNLLNRMIIILFNRKLIADV